MKDDNGIKKPADLHGGAGLPREATMFHFPGEYDSGSGGCNGPC